MSSIQTVLVGVSGGFRTVLITKILADFSTFDLVSGSDSRLATMFLDSLPATRGACGKILLATRPRSGTVPTPKLPMEAGVLARGGQASDHHTFVFRSPVFICLVLLVRLVLFVGV